MCARNVSLISQALYDFESAESHFPPGAENETGPILNLPRGLHQNWISLVLPMLDERTTATHINREISVYDAAHDPVRTISLAVLVCPSQGISTQNARQTNYVGIHHDLEAAIDTDNKGLLYLNSSITRDDIPDGSAHTLLLGEKRNEHDSDLGWLSGTRASLRNTGSRINQKDSQQAVQFTNPELPSHIRPRETGQQLTQQAKFVGGLSSDHPAGPMIAFADGHVQPLRDGMDDRTLRQLGNRQDGSLLDFENYR
jgi:prepilin-type processing-associated H-X9-DG protein